MKLDHVVFAVADLAAAEEKLETELGLASVAGGRHPDWGTENRIVPLGDAYLELIAVADEAEAAASLFGRWVAGNRDDEPRPLGWAVRTDDLDAAAGRLGLEVREGARRTGSGEELRWRYAGVEQAMAEACVPFFIEWAQATPFPGHVDDPRFRIRELHVAGDPGRIHAWLGPGELPLVVRPGKPTVVRVVLEGPGREVVLSGGGP